jgi:hypothetical protein
MISLNFQLPAYISIHNLCSSTELTSPIYFCNGATYRMLFDQQANIGTGVCVCLEIDNTQSTFEGALLYKLQRKTKVESDDRSNVGTTAEKANRNEEKCAQMLIGWKMDHCIPRMYVMLIEHVKELTWNEDKLKKLHYENCSQLDNYCDSKSTSWLMDDNTVLKTIFKVTKLDGSFKQSITISEKKKDDADYNSSTHIRPTQII